MDNLLCENLLTPAGGFHSLVKVCRHWEHFFTGL
jgi:hypothetical protein